ncbi:MAG: hypothetical protein IID01_00020 [Chloroflexi bacterium]|nr:hypothetical protein [Chloroflexota bacterium]
MRTQETTRHREQFALRRNELALQTLRVRELAFEFLTSLKDHKIEIDNAGAPSSEVFQPTISRISDDLVKDIAELTEKSAQFDQNFIENTELNTANLSAANEDYVFGKIMMLHALEADLKARIKAHSGLQETMKVFWRELDLDSC